MHLDQDFFARPCLEVAPELVGCRLVHNDSGTRLAGRIVEVEAYLGQGVDPGSHAYRRSTPRNRVMFGPPGHLYVYRIMGIHLCANIVCEPDGQAAAVLLRAVEPLEGLEVMQARRGERPTRELTNGPGKLTQAFGVCLEDSGRSIIGDLRIEPSECALENDILVGPRIGLSEGQDLPYRFFVAGSRFVTPSPLNRRAGPHRA